MDNECERMTCKKVKYCLVEDRYWKSENPKFRLLELFRFWSLLLNHLKKHHSE